MIQPFNDRLFLGAQATKGHSKWNFKNCSLESLWKQCNVLWNLTVVLVTHQKVKIQKTCSHRSVNFFFPYSILLQGITRVLYLLSVLVIQKIIKMNSEGCANILNRNWNYMRCTNCKRSLFYIIEHQNMYCTLANNKSFLRQEKMLTGPSVFPNSD